jgi:large subunit ribosomal protein L9
VKIILMDDVPALGRRGEVREVADGYARNYLVPKKLAIQATPVALRDVERIRQGQERAAQKAKREAEGLASRIREVALTVPRQAGEDGKLFGSVTAQDIVKGLAAERIRVEKRQIHLGEPLKTLGEHLVPIRLPAEVTAEVRVQIVPK